MHEIAKRNIEFFKLIISHNLQVHLLPPIGIADAAGIGGSVG